MKKINIAIPHTAVAMKCKSGDEKPGRPWCVYKDGKDGEVLKNQPKGWPKTYKSEKDAKAGIKLMKTFGVDIEE